MALQALVSGALLLQGLLTLALMTFAPRHRHLAYFAGLSVLWGLIHAQAWWSPPLGSPLLREALPLGLVSAASCAYQRFLCLYADLKAPWLDRLAWAQLLWVAVLVPAAGIDQVHHTAMVGQLGAAGIAAGCTLLFLRHAHEPRQRPMRGMAVVLLWGLLVALVELLAGMGRAEPLAAWTLRWSVPLTLVLLGALQLMEFGAQAQRLVAMQGQLEQQIAKGRQELELNFKRWAETRIEHMTSVERRRMAADLHDDLGAKLLTIVHTSPSDRVAALGREALDEMRLSVRGLTGRPLGLSEALADWRTEAMARLASADIALDWPLPEDDPQGPDDPVQMLGARTMVQATRIMREVFSNLIRHSQASHCTVATLLGPGHVTLDIRDNGVGFDIDRWRHRQGGLGLFNMEHRAEQLQGKCLIESTPGHGTRVRLTLPFQDLST